MELKRCPTPWCQSNTVHTTTYYTSGKDADGNVIRVVEVDHHCTKCRVSTPRLPREDADMLWNCSTGPA